jgi:anti-anti-sigma factor
VAKVVGDVDLSRTNEFQQALLEVLDAPPDRLVVEMSGVAYIDSSGVASLVKVLGRARRMGLSLRLAGLTSQVRSVLEITRLNTVFDVYATEAEALA